MAAKVVCSKISNRRKRVPRQVEENGRGLEAEEEPQFAAINEPHTKPSCCRRFCDFLSRCCRRLRNPVRRRRTARTRGENSNDGGNLPRNPNSPISEQVAPRIPEEFQPVEPGLPEEESPALPSFREKTNEHKEHAYPELNLERARESAEEIQREEPGLLVEESSALPNLQTQEKTNEPINLDKKHALPELRLDCVEESPEEVLIEEPEPMEDPLDEVHASGVQEDQLAIELKADSVEFKTLNEREGSDKVLPISDHQNCSASTGFDLALAVNALIDEELEALEEKLNWIVNSSSPVGPEDFNDVIMKLDDLEEDYFSICPFYAQPEEALKFAVLRSLRSDEEQPGS